MMREYDGTYWIAQHYYIDQRPLQEYYRGWQDSSTDGLASVYGEHYLSGKAHECWAKYGTRGFISEDDAKLALNYIREHCQINLVKFRMALVHTHRSIVTSFE